MRKRNLVLTIAGAAAICFGLVQVTKRSTSQRIEDLPKESKRDVIRVPVPPETMVPRRLEGRVVKPDRELHRKQDRERNFFEWRDGKLENHAFASSVSGG